VIESSTSRQPYSKPALLHLRELEDFRLAFEEPRREVEPDVDVPDLDLFWLVAFRLCDLVSARAALDAFRLLEVFVRATDVDFFRPLPLDF
jgi:hypothetical protein